MIEFRHVTKTFPGGHDAVKDLSLTVPTGSVTVLVGSSGCGKTTLLRMVNRMVEPTSGDILIDRKNVTDQDPVALRRKIGYVMQSGGLLPHRTVSQNIQTVPRLIGTPKGVSRARAVELMETVGLDSELATRYPSQLSGGQQQRVGVARALAVDPNILLMDEPFGAVDPLVRRDLQRELIRLQSSMNKTVVFVTHDIDEAFLLGDQVVILREGAQIAQQGTPAEIISRPANDFVSTFIGHTDAQRELSVREEQGVAVLVDDDGRIHGRLKG
jgi:osmoprotectant transport system ATP-binding protein